MSIIYSCQKSRSQISSDFTTKAFLDLVLFFVICVCPTLEFLLSCCVISFEVRYLLKIPPNNLLLASQTSTFGTATLLLLCTIYRNCRYQIIAHHFLLNLLPKGQRKFTDAILTNEPEIILNFRAKEKSVK